MQRESWEDLILGKRRYAEGITFPVFNGGTTALGGPVFLPSRDTEGTTFPKRQREYTERATVPRSQ